MNWPYLHTIVNHFPIILNVVGAVVLLLALVIRRRGLWLYGLATMTLAGSSVYPAYLTGDEAAEALEGTWYIVPAAVKEHGAAADFALWWLLLTGAVCAYAWWRMLRRDVAGLPPVWLRTVTAILAVFTFSVVARTAYLGGKIVHESPRLAHPEVNASPAPRR